MNTPDLRPVRGRLRLLLLGMAALVFAGLSVYLADRHVGDTIARHREASKVIPPVTVPVVVAKFDLIAGEAVTADNMAVRSIPADLAPGSALRPEQFDGKVGMRLARALRSGEPLLAEILQAVEPGGLSTRVRQGIRALTIAVDDVNAVSGMLRPGDRIDLLFSARAAGAELGPGVETARVLVQNVTVLATGRQFRSGADEPSSRPFTSITVELTPEDATRLVVAQRAGRITALLRNPDDRHAVSTSPVDAHALVGGVARGPSPPPRIAVPSGPELIIGGTGNVSANRSRTHDDAPILPMGASAPGAGASPNHRAHAVASGSGAVNAQPAPPQVGSMPLAPSMPPVTQPLLIR